VSGQLHDPAALPWGKEPWCALARRLGGPQSRPGQGGGEEEEEDSPFWESNPDCPVRRLVIRYPGFMKLTVVK
jgi:hypothetical protein